jgi:hypothetical protein
MADEDAVEEKQIHQDPEEGATGRRWKVSITLVVLGVAVLVYGLIDHYDPAIAAGVVLILFFGAVAAGARKVTTRADPLHQEADFTAPPPPKEPGRKIYLPRGRRGSKSKR